MRQATNSRIAKLSPQHELLALMVIEHPEWDNAQLGEAVGFSKGYVSVVKNSDVFNDRLTELAEELGQRVLGGVHDKIKAAGMEIIDAIREKVARPADQVSERFLVDAAKTILPYAAPQVPTKGDAPTVHLHVNSEVIMRARERERALFDTQLPQRQIESAPAALEDSSDAFVLEVEQVQ